MRDTIVIDESADVDWPAVIAHMERRKAMRSDGPPETMRRIRGVGERAGRSSGQPETDDADALQAGRQPSSQEK